RLARTPAPGCASLTRATRLTGATRLHVARIRPKAASGVAHGSVATRAQGPARTLPQGARTGTATLGRPAGPGCASLTRATRLTGATRLHVARIRPKAASGSHADPLRRGRRGLPEHCPRGRTQGTPRLARTPAPGCASLTRATRLTGATRLHVARIR